MSMQVGTAELSVGIIRELMNYGFCSYSVDQHLEGIGNSLREHYPQIPWVQVGSSVSGATPEIESPEKNGFVFSSCTTIMVEKDCFSNFRT
ncbi:hypothetical protein RHMOL_Rhmol06G0023600 [Rhododendron molle]|uniref:Uncharacterized protein n=1 Tax=Rhododendron molle TaxID=49168 RepID=A0ACC0NA80_RHOML|nr:hypothetical protein RHMOL_Rhmol06G0023600 [Rhododendron molle]